MERFKRKKTRAIDFAIISTTAFYFRFMQWNKESEKEKEKEREREKIHLKFIHFMYRILFFIQAKCMFNWNSSSNSNSRSTTTMNHRFYIIFSWIYDRKIKHTQHTRNKRDIHNFEFDKNKRAQLHQHNRKRKRKRKHTWTARRAHAQWSKRGDEKWSNGWREENWEESNAAGRYIVLFFLFRFISRFDELHLDNREDRQMSTFQ